MVSPVETTGVRNMATSSKQQTARTRKAEKRDRHFHELLDLASEGNEEAIQDLWLQYQYDFAKKGRGDE
jgi:hypothetical protein